MAWGHPMSATVPASIPSATHTHRTPLKTPTQGPQGEQLPPFRDHHPWVIQHHHHHRQHQHQSSVICHPHHCRLPRRFIQASIGFDVIFINHCQHAGKELPSCFALWAWLASLSHNVGRVVHILPRHSGGRDKKRHRLSTFWFVVCGVETSEWGGGGGSRWLFRSNLLWHPKYFSTNPVQDRTWNDLNVIFCLASLCWLFRMSLPVFTS